MHRTPNQCEEFHTHSQTFQLRSRAVCRPTRCASLLA